MKKLLIICGIITAVLLFSNCSGTKKATATSTTPKLTYEANLQPMIVAHCTPCHIPAKGGFKKAYDSYAAVSGDIDEIIRRIELHPGERGFMPMKHDRLSDSTIAVFKQWKLDGLMEKL